MVPLSPQLPALPAGPAEPYDLHTTESSFQYLRTHLQIHPDIFCVAGQSREHPSIVVNHPDYLKHILVANHKNYIKGPGFERVKMLLGNGIIVSDGAFWRRQRRMIQPAFSRDIIADLMQRMKQPNLQLLDQWRQQSAQQAAVDITRVTNELALEIILRALFGDDFDDLRQDEGGHAFSILTDSSARDLQLVKAFRGLSKWVQFLIDKRRARPGDSVDFLNIMMAARDKDTGQPMTDKELIDEVMTLIVAGSETSATTMNWTWYLLAQHPQIEARVHETVDNAQFDVAPDISQLDQLAYLRQVIEEALRLYPPVWLYSRTALDEDRLGPYRVPAHANIFIAPYFVHRHRDFWRDPEHFDPERFAPARVKQRHKQAYIPFSAGPRRCIGDFFGIVEVQMHIAMLARHFRLQMGGAERIELAPEVNLRSKRPIHMNLVARSG